MFEHLSTYSKFKSSKKYKNSWTVARILETTETFKTHRKKANKSWGKKTSRLWGEKGSFMLTKLAEIPGERKELWEWDGQWPGAHPIEGAGSCDQCGHLFSASVLNCRAWYWDKNLTGQIITTVIVVSRITAILIPSLHPGNLQMCDITW